MSCEGYSVRAVSPVDDPDLRCELIRIANEPPAYRWPGADDRGALRHATTQRVDEPPAALCPWGTVWDLIRPGITPDRVAELRAAIDSRRDDRLALRVHAAECALYQPPPPPVQLDLLDLVGAR